MEKTKIKPCLSIALLWLLSWVLAGAQPPQQPVPPGIPASDTGAPPPPPPGLREGPPFRRGPGPGSLGGRLPGMAAHLPARRWDEIDQRLQEFRNSYDADLVRRDAIIETLAAERRRLDPGKLDAAAVMTQKLIDKRMGELHQLVERTQNSAQEAGDLLTGALLTRNIWEPGLRREKPQPTSATQAGDPGRQWQERRKVWLDALDRLDKEGPEGFAKAVVGDRFGVEIAQSLPERLRRPGLNLWRRDGALSPKRRQLIDSIRQNWQGRIERMEKQHEELRRELLRQERELRQMRLILENVLAEPDAP